MRKKRRTKKRYQRIAELMRNMLRTGWASNLNRLNRLHSRWNCIVKDMNDNLNKSEEYKRIGFKPEPISRLLKLTNWYADQREMRKSLIVNHKDFCCPVSGTILDMDDSFILTFKSNTTIVSSSGLNKLIEKHGNNIIGLINT